MEFTTINQFPKPELEDVPNIQLAAHPLATTVELRVVPLFDKEVDRNATSMDKQVALTDNKAYMNRIGVVGGQIVWSSGFDRNPILSIRNGSWRSCYSTYHRFSESTIVVSYIAFTGSPNSIYYFDGVVTLRAAPTNTGSFVHNYQSGTTQFAVDRNYAFSGSMETSFSYNTSNSNLNTGGVVITEASTNTKMVIHPIHMLYRPEKATLHDSTIPAHLIQLNRTGGDLITGQTPEFRGRVIELGEVGPF